MSVTPVSFCIDISNALPVYAQIENQVKFAITAGKLKPGDALPSVRELSELLKINPNTISRAYRDLEILHLVRTRRGVGVTIAELAAEHCRDSTCAMVHQHLMEAVAECAAAGIPAADIRTMVAQAIESGAHPYHATGEDC